MTLPRFCIRVKRMTLGDMVANLFRLTPRQKSALAKLGVKTIGDLLFHFPARYEEIGGVRPIAQLREGERRA